ncbi:hypothetical protein D3C86_1463030 [compost metagenome]
MANRPPRHPDRGPEASGRRAPRQGLPGLQRRDPYLCGVRPHEQPLRSRARGPGSDGGDADRVHARQQCRCGHDLDRRQQDLPDQRAAEHRPDRPVPAPPDRGRRGQSDGVRSPLSAPPPRDREPAHDLEDGAGPRGLGGCAGFRPEHPASGRLSWNRRQRLRGPARPGRPERPDLHLGHDGSVQGLHDHRQPDVPFRADADAVCALRSRRHLLDAPAAFSHERHRHRRRLGDAGRRDHFLCAQVLRVRLLAGD